MQSLKKLFKTQKKIINDEILHRDDKKIPTTYVDDKTILHIVSLVIAQEYGLKGKTGIQPVLYQNHTVFVKFSHSLWAQEVWTNRGYLIRMINERIGKKVVYKIKAQ